MWLAKILNESLFWLWIKKWPELTNICFFSITNSLFISLSLLSLMLSPCPSSSSQTLQQCQVWLKESLFQKEQKYFSNPGQETTPICGCNERIISLHQQIQNISRCYTYCKQRLSFRLSFWHAHKSLQLCANFLSNSSMSLIIWHLSLLFWHSICCIWQ